MIELKQLITPFFFFILLSYIELSQCYTLEYELVNSRPVPINLRRHVVHVRDKICKNSFMVTNNNKFKTKGIFDSISNAIFGSPDQTFSFSVVDPVAFKKTFDVVRSTAQSLSDTLNVLDFIVKQTIKISQGVVSLAGINWAQTDYNDPTSYTIRLYRLVSNSLFAAIHFNNWVLDTPPKQIDQLKSQTVRYYFQSSILERKKTVHPLCYEDSWEGPGIYIAEFVMSCEVDIYTGLFISGRTHGCVERVDIYNMYSESFAPLLPYPLNAGALNDRIPNCVYSCQLIEFLFYAYTQSGKPFPVIDILTTYPRNPFVTALITSMDGFDEFLGWLNSSPGNSPLFQWSSAVVPSPVSKTVGFEIPQIWDYKRDFVQDLWCGIQNPSRSYFAHARLEFELTMFTVSRNTIYSFFNNYFLDKVIVPWVPSQVIPVASTILCPTIHSGGYISYDSIGEVSLYRLLTRPIFNSNVSGTFFVPAINVPEYVGYSSTGSLLLGEDIMSGGLSSWQLNKLSNDKSITIEKTFSIKDGIDSCLSDRRCVELGRIIQVEDKKLTITITNNLMQEIKVVDYPSPSLCECAADECTGFDYSCIPKGNVTSRLCDVPCSTSNCDVIQYKYLICADVRKINISVYVSDVDGNFTKVFSNQLAKVEKTSVDNSVNLATSLITITSIKNRVDQSIRDLDAIGSLTTTLSFTVKGQRGLIDELSSKLTDFVNNIASITGGLVDSVSVIGKSLADLHTGFDNLGSKIDDFAVMIGGGIGSAGKDLFNAVYGGIYGAADSIIGKIMRFITAILPIIAGILFTIGFIVLLYYSPTIYAWIRKVHKEIKLSKADRAKVLTGEQISKDDKILSKDDEIEMGMIKPVKNAEDILKDDGTIRHGRFMTMVDIDGDFAGQTRNGRLTGCGYCWRRAAVRIITFVSITGKCRCCLHTCCKRVQTMKTKSDQIFLSWQVRTGSRNIANCKLLYADFLLDCIKRGSIVKKTLWSSEREFYGEITYNKQGIQKEDLFDTAYMFGLQNVIDIEFMFVRTLYNHNMIGGPSGFFPINMVADRARANTDIDIFTENPLNKVKFDKLTLLLNESDPPLPPNPILITMDDKNENE